MIRPSQAESVAAVVLAAGASSRMGSPKPLLPLAEGTYLSRILSTLADCALLRVIVVLGSSADEVRAGVNLAGSEVLVNERWRDGMLSSLLVAVRAVEVDPAVSGLLVSLVDVPRFDRSTVLALLKEQRRSAAPVVVPTYGGRRGHPVLFDRSVFDELLAAPADQGARAVVHAHADSLREVAVDDPWIVRDSDTPAEHRRMIADEVPEP